MVEQFIATMKQKLIALPNASSPPFFSYFIHENSQEKNSQRSTQSHAIILMIAVIYINIVQINMIYDFAPSALFVSFLVQSPLQCILLLRWSSPIRMYIHMYACACGFKWSLRIYVVLNIFEFFYQPSLKEILVSLIAVSSTHWLIGKPIGIEISIDARSVGHGCPYILF